MGIALCEGGLWIAFQENAFSGRNIRNKGTK